MWTFVNEVKSDLYRCEGRTSIKNFVRMILFNAGFKYMFYTRLTKNSKNNKITKLIIFPFSWIVQRHLMYKYGINIPYSTNIGLGFKINHFSGIVINSKSKIGNNVTICQGVTIGKQESGKIGCPTIGDSVYIGPGAKVLGNIKIGDNALIGANAVVTSDILENEIVAPEKSKVISNIGSKNYIKNKYTIKR